ncbi:hypothetical protein [Paenibacillus ginsengihumi]|uniref:hypothetical protein n=1 Tax=Paenibacillus ginsengihumi TaxID=431596 RepID=UPI003CCC3170
MGVGLILVISPGTVEAVVNHLGAFGLKSYVIGEIVEGNKQVVFQREIVWD